MSKLMEKDVYNAAVNGDVTIFSIKNHDQLLKKTYQNSNIIHIGAQHQRLDFIKAALNSFPSTPTCVSLICDQNSHGNTPLHIAAQVGNEPIIDQLYEFFSTQCGDSGGSDQVFPWRVTNEDGNTPAHVALLSSNVSVAMYLVDKDDDVARVLNRSKETLLHLAIRYHVFENNVSQSQTSETLAPSCSETVYQPTEDLLPIVELLLGIESSVTCWADADGSTPLLRAASLKSVYCLRVIKAMLVSCPEAAEIRDEESGNTILHLLMNHQVESYEQGQELMNIPHVYTLKNSNNHQRDTPMHLAARNRDFIMVRVLKESSPRLGLMNKSGVSADSLVRELENQMRITKRPRKLTREEREAAKQGNASFLNERLASIGMNLLISQTPMGGNILHILMKYPLPDSDLLFDALDFIRQAVQTLPSLICQQDHNGDTPLHILANNKKSYSIYLLDIFSKYYAEVGEKAGGDARLQPWEMKNAKGDTPLHVAVRAGSYDLSMRLLKLGEDVAGYVNNHSQTPLHLLSYLYHFADRDEEVDELLRGLIIGNADLAYMQDEDGLTPLLTAVLKGTMPMIKILHQECPDCLKISDFKGRTMWHLFVSPPLERNIASDDFRLRFGTFRVLISQEDDTIRRLMGSKDNNGNTPLHLAIENGQFGFAQFFLENWKSDDSGWSIVAATPNYEELLSVENKEGVSSYNLIGSAEYLPREFEKFLCTDGNLLYGHRSVYGVPTTKMEEYANTVSVVAALLATVTFTAAFTVPGGLSSSTGYPLLLRNAAFQVFLTADVVAMCSSMMVLFCNLWIMTTDNKTQSLLLLDVSVFLLQTSFHATLLTFMTGVYVTTISVVPGIAISTCVACTSLIILMHKKLVMRTVVPVLWLWVILGPVLMTLASNRLSSMWSWINKPKSPRSSEKKPSP